MQRPFAALRAMDDGMHSHPGTALAPALDRTHESPMAGFSEPEPAWSDWEPRMETHDDGTAINLIFEIPEVPPHTLSVAVNARSLTIFGSHPVQPGRGDNEAEYGRFRRQVTLPCDVRAAEREVNLWRGLLIIRLPR
jgi:HSP20 family molecular chaperone IbpA